MTDAHIHSEQFKALSMADWGAVVLAALLSFAVYSMTTNSGVGFYDSAELALRASQPGATHAPGAPLHTLLGYLLSRIVSDPVTATNLLSSLGGSLATGVACLLIISFGASRFISIAGAMTFALAAPVWANSIVTETYNLNLFILACCIYVGWRWRLSGDPRLLLALAILYGLGMAAHFGSIILLPAFVFLVCVSHPQAIKNTSIFCATVALMLCVIATANLLLAANVPPFGEVKPDSLASLYLYMSGAEHEPLKSSGLMFYLGRVFQHTLIFSRHYLYLLIPAGLAGAYLLVRRDRKFAVFLGLIFAAYMGYFTLFGPGDYDSMVGPAYFVYSLAIAVGVAALIRRQGSKSGGRIGNLILLVAVILMFAIQFQGRYAEANTARVDQYVHESFALMPDNSIVIAGWREFTVLSYYQQIYALRPDLTIILPATTVRHYPQGDVADYRGYLAEHACERPIVTNKPVGELRAEYDLVSLAGQDDWKRVVRRVANACAH